MGREEEGGGMRKRGRCWATANGHSMGAALSGGLRLARSPSTARCLWLSGYGPESRRVAGDSVNRKSKAERSNDLNLPCSAG